MQEWNEVGELLTTLAATDIGAGGGVQPTLAVFHGEEALLLVGVRPFAPGAYHQPMVEVCALAGALGADRLMLSMGGRAWSADDPIVPVVDGPDGEEVDLRQRVVMVHTVDAHAGDGLCGTVLHPYVVEDGAARFEAPVAMGRGEGWITGVLEVTAASAAELRGTPDATLDQLARCLSLGHEVSVGTGLPDRLAELADAPG